MQVYCQYSGITYDVANFARLKLEYVHPIFTASPKHLLSRAGDWAAGRFNEQERKLLFLALLHSTELVEFRCYAAPDDSTVQKNMEATLKFVGWMSGLTNPAIAFPKFAITRETQKLPNIKYWLEAWWDAKQQFEEGYVSTSQLAKLRNREAALERLIKNAGKKVDDYSGLLGLWAMDAADVPKGLRQYWIELFKLKGIKIYGAKTVDLEELVEHMEEYLEHGSIYAAATLRHVRSLLKQNKAGLGFSLGMSSETLEGVDLQALVDNPYRIVEDDLETYNKQVVAATAPTEEPVESAYPNKVAYLRAKAAWTLNKKAVEYAAEFTQQVEDDDAAMNTDAAITEELSDVVDPIENQITQYLGEQDD